MRYEDIIPMGQGNMKPLTPLEQQRDDVGFTHPNLHRRIDPSQPEGEYFPRDYELFISGTESNRLTQTFVRDENDNTPNEDP